MIYIISILASIFVIIITITLIWSFWKYLRYDTRNLKNSLKKDGNMDTTINITINIKPKKK